MRESKGAKERKDTRYRVSVSGEQIILDPRCIKARRKNKTEWQ